MDDKLSYGLLLLFYTAKSKLDVIINAYISLLLCIHTFITCNYMSQDDTLKLFSLTFHKIYENLMKNNVTCRYVKICILIRHTFCESLVKIQRQMPLIFVFLFFRHRVVFSTFPGSNKIIHLTLGVYSWPLHRLV